MSNVKIDPEIFEWLDNEFVDDEKTFGKKLGYTKDAYVAMAKYLFDEGMTPLEAFRAMGFDPDVLGEDQANRLAQRARKLYEEDPDFTKKKYNYDGAIDIKKMPHLSQDEELAFMEARIEYLQKLIEAGKELNKLLRKRFP